MAEQFDHQSIAKKWTERWLATDLNKFKEDSVKPKKYILDMYPYPSGAGLHVGHAEGYTATDIISRYFRMKGFNVLHPMGWDSFGLPAENYAIKTGVHPDITTNEAINTFKSQMNNLGLSYDWSRELASHNPEYYRWTQWLFLYFYKKGLVYRKNAPVNWCPKDNTVLANEQVIDGKCERCDSEVIQKDMLQWFFKITDYSDRLIDDLAKIDWPESTKLGQINWIGKSEGARIKFAIKKTDDSQSSSSSNSSIRKATDADAEQIATIRVEGWLDNNIDEETGFTKEFLKSTGFDYPVSEKQIESTKKYIASSEIYVYEKDGQVKGFIGVNKTDDIDVMEFGIYIARDLRGQGIGSELMQYVFNLFPDKGFFIQVSKKNQRAINLYERLGFTIIGESKYSRPNHEDTILPLFDMKKASSNSIEVFSTAHDTIFGATFVVISPENKFFKENIEKIINKSEVEQYIEAAKGKTELERQQQKEKTGVKLEGLVAINPMTKQEIPIFIADYVLNGYGTGAVMGVPGHDERDFEFANRYDLPIIFVTETDQFISYSDSIKKNLSAFKVTNSAEYTGMDYVTARAKMLENMEAQGIAKREVNYRLRDWLLSRQRYWGCPIPIVYDPEGNAHPVPEEHLPVMIPTDVDFRPTGESPLVYSESFHKSAEELYGKGWKREVDTMDTFVDSSWYFFRFADSHNNEAFASTEKMNAVLPVDIYMGGAEHTVLHLMYARFFTKVLFDDGLINFDEPFMKLRHQGTILAEDSRKMSKRWGNVINPDAEVATYGADTLRMYEMFMGPLKDSKPWNTRTEQGVHRFITRIWNLKEHVGTADTTKIAQDAWINKLVDNTGKAIEDLTFNTAISKFMEFVNYIYAEVLPKKEQIDTNIWEKFLIILAPFAPFITEELWSQLGNGFSIHQQSWPSVDASALQSEEVTVAVQINGKLRANLHVSADISSEEIKSLTFADIAVQKYISNPEQIKKFIYVPGKIVSIVV